MNDLARNVLILIVTFSLGAGVGRFSRPDKKIETSISQQKDTSIVASTDITKVSDSTEKDQSHVTNHKETKLPDGTVISEDIVGDYLTEKTAKENIVLKQQINESEKENITLHQTIEEMKKPSVLITIIPAYHFNAPLVFSSIEYTFMIQKHVFWECYLGISLDKYMVGLPLTCGF